MTAAHDTLSESQRELWAKAAAQLEGLKERELAWAKRVKDDLISHEGYFKAAQARVLELSEIYRDRPHWSWAAERWNSIMREGGLTAVLKLLGEPVTHQELLSASPFAVMRPPLPENTFYAAYADG
jgi:hypothetical protein